MPLARGASKKVISSNIREMMASGKFSQPQAIAAALRMAGAPKGSNSGRAKGKKRAK